MIMLIIIIIIIIMITTVITIILVRVMCSSGAPLHGHEHLPAQEAAEQLSNS